MGKTLTEIAQQLSTPKTVKKTVPQKTKEVDEVKPVPKVQLIYAFNGTGKTRLSRAFKELIAPRVEGEGSQSSELAAKKILYYSAFTEDLFFWDNDLGQDAEPKLIIQPNAFTRWVLEEQGKEQSIARTFQRYTSDKLTPHFSADFSSVSFSFARGNLKWSELLPDDKQLYYSRIINFTSHSTLSNEAAAQPTPAERAMVKLLLEHLKNSHGFWRQ